jgi:hypothetical protein
LGLQLNDRHREFVLTSSTGDPADVIWREHAGLISRTHAAQLNRPPIAAQIGTQR